MSFRGILFPTNLGCFKMTEHQKETDELDLHENTHADIYRITKVPGGWIYSTCKTRWVQNTHDGDGYEEDSVMTSVFVPEPPK